MEPGPLRSVSFLFTTVFCPNAAKVKNAAGEIPQDKLNVVSSALSKGKYDLFHLIPVGRYCSEMFEIACLKTYIQDLGENPFQGSGFKGEVPLKIQTQNP